MAQIVLGMALSHGPMLSTPPAMWDLRAQADRANRSHWYRGRPYDYSALAAERGGGYAPAITLDERECRHAACQRALGELSRRFAEARPDLAIVVGNDQLEVFKEDLLPAIVVYAGDAIENIPLSEAQRAKLPPGIAVAEEGHCPPGGRGLSRRPAEARLVLRSLVEQHFDAAQSVRLPKGPDRQHGIPHAFGFLYRNTMRDAPPPSIPVFLNVGVPPNQPTLRRCLDLGKALERAIAGLAPQGGAWRCSPPAA